MSDQPDREPSLQVLQPRRGRPPADEPHSTVSVWLPESDHDRLIEIARRTGLSVSATIRTLLDGKLNLK